MILPCRKRCLIKSGPLDAHMNNKILCVCGTHYICYTQLHLRLCHPTSSLFNLLSLNRLLEYKIILTKHEKKKNLPSSHLISLKASIFNQCLPSAYTGVYSPIDFGTHKQHKKKKEIKDEAWEKWKFVRLLFFNFGIFHFLLAEIWSKWIKLLFFYFFSIFFYILQFTVLNG